MRVVSSNFRTEAITAKRHFCSEQGRDEGVHWFPNGIPCSFCVREFFCCERRYLCAWQRG